MGISDFLKKRNTLLKKDRIREQTDLQIEQDNSMRKKLVKDLSQQQKKNPEDISALIK